VDLPPERPIELAAMMGTRVGRKINPVFDKFRLTRACLSLQHLALFAAFCCVLNRRNAAVACFPNFLESFPRLGLHILGVKQCSAMTAIVSHLFFLNIAPILEGWVHIYEKFQLNRDLIFCIWELVNQQLSTKRNFANQLHKAHELTQCTA